MGIERKPRLHLREKDQAFFNNYIQDIKLDELAQLDLGTLKNESQRHIKENCDLLAKSLDMAFQKNEENIVDFCKFLLTRCFIVVVCTPNQQSAFRVFSVMNSRGLDLMPIDIIKSDIIGKIPEKEQQAYTDKWEELEIQTTRSGFNDVFMHTRMIFAKTKAKQNLLDDFREVVLTKVSPKELVDNILEPYANAYTVLTKRKYESSKNAEQINQYLFWLNKIDNADWMPVAIKFMAEKGKDAEYVLWFAKKLERLSSYLFITAKDVNGRIERYRHLLEEMEENPDHCLDDPLASIELSNEEKKEFVNALNGDIYPLTGKRRNYIILRLNEFVGDGAGKFDFDPNILTIEHVLPQTVDADSEWAKWWPDVDQRNDWVNKIANLVLLTKKKNSEAQNYDFAWKKDKYFKGKNGTTTYPLTTQVLNEKEWTPETVERRQGELLKRFKICWDLKYFDSVTQKADFEDARLFYIKGIRGANAVGYQAEGSRFVVKKGSKLSDDVMTAFKDNNPEAYRIREGLSGEIVDDGVFQKDHSFNNIALAASVILGRNATGKTEWKDENGLKFEEIPRSENETLENFNINDESTYGNIKTGRLAFELFQHVFDLGNITDEEVEKLKTKEYSKKLFSRTVYPILADSREDNQGNSNKTRYRKTPISYKGQDIYITTQWYEGNRKDVISWYKRHL